jgi:S-adenosylmethionine decarboxylase
MEETLVDFYFNDSSFLRNVEPIKTHLITEAKKANANIIHEHFHQFQPDGITGVLVLKESHICVHTWTENYYMSLSVFSCGSFDATLLVQLLKNILKPKKTRVRIIKRNLGHIDRDFKKSTTKSDLVSDVKLRQVLWKAATDKEFRDNIFGKTRMALKDAGFDLNPEEYNQLRWFDPEKLESFGKDAKSLLTSYFLQK